MLTQAAFQCAVLIVIAGAGADGVLVCYLFDIIAFYNFIPKPFSGWNAMRAIFLFYFVQLKLQQQQR